MIWLGLALTFGIGTLVWWLLIRTEGVYLGRGMVVWLYDLYASRYDGIVQMEDEDEQIHLAYPIMKRLYPETHPLVLDVATGTGRIPIALAKHSAFEGHVIGLDASRKMLEQAIRKVQEQGLADTTSFMWGDGQSLPFEDKSFDMVTCMEALEFMPQPEAGLKELVRVLRPDGLLLTTRRINEFMPSKLWSEAKMAELLHKAGMTNIEFDEWQYDYTKVWAYKRGESEFIGAMPFEALPLRGDWRQSPDGIYEKNL
jgi:ubiquinone/menaquinone biosynthesis C-methylase UbiE